MAVYRVPVFWSGPFTAGGGLSNFYYNSAGGTIAQAITATVLFLQATDDRRAVGCNWSCGTDVDTLNVGTGALEATDSVTPALGFGTAAGDAAPIATQGLLRMTTGVIGPPPAGGTSGRLLRGRLFLPAVVEADNTGGVPNGTYQTDYNTAASTLIGTANADWSVWSKTHGILASVLAASCWTQWAVLRSRRD